MNILEILGAITGQTPPPVALPPVPEPEKTQDRIPQGDPYATAFLGQVPPEGGVATPPIQLPQTAPNPAPRPMPETAIAPPPAARPARVGPPNPLPQQLDDLLRRSGGSGDVTGGQGDQNRGGLSGVFDAILGPRTSTGPATFRDRLAAGLSNSQGPYGFGRAMGAAMGADRKISGDELEKKLKLLQGARGVRQDDTRDYQFEVNTDLKNRGLDIRRNYLNRPTAAVRAAWNKPDAQRAADAERILNGMQKRIWAEHGLGQGSNLFGAKREEALKAARAAFAAAQERVYRQQGLNVDGTPLAPPSGPRHGPVTMQPTPNGLNPVADPTKPLGKVNNPHMPKTQAEFDAIQPGEVYVNPKDGKSYVKIDRTQMNVPPVELEPDEDLE